MRIRDLMTTQTLPESPLIVLPVVENHDGDIYGVSRIPVLDLVALIVKEVEKSGAVELRWSDEGMTFHRP